MKSKSKSKRAASAAPASRHGMKLRRRDRGPDGSGRGVAIDACNDDIVVSIASFLPSRDLLSLALTCRRFGARDDPSPPFGGIPIGWRDSILRTTKLKVGSKALAMPNGRGESMLRECEIIGRRTKRCGFHMYSIEQHDEWDCYEVQFHCKKSNSIGQGKQWMHEREVIGLEDMTKRMKKNLVYHVEKREGGDISICRFTLDERMNVCPSFVQKIGTEKSKELNEAYFEGGWKKWSLMEEVALQKSIEIVAESEGCLLWREGQSWIGNLRQFEREVEVLSEGYESSISLSSMDTEQVTSRIYDHLGVVSEYLNYLTESLEESRTDLRLSASIKRVKRRSPLWRALADRHDESVRWLVAHFENGTNGIMRNFPNHEG
ncbi:hypothetical protein ACHAWF_011832 [Thalassiosira exigua]